MHCQAGGLIHCLTQYAECGTECVDNPSLKQKRQNVDPVLLLLFCTSLNSCFEDENCIRIQKIVFTTQLRLPLNMIIKYADYFHIYHLIQSKNYVDITM